MGVSCQLGLMELRMVHEFKLWCNKRKKGRKEKQIKYRHFDTPSNIEKLEPFLGNKHKISSHSFYPLISTSIETVSFVDQRTINCLERSGWSSQGSTTNHHHHCQVKRCKGGRKSRRQRVSMSPSKRSMYSEVQHG